MLHHVSLGSNDIERARKFYEPVMRVLGLRLMHSRGKSLDYGTSRTEFSIETPVDGKPATKGNGVHICFEAESREIVKRFYREALANGGTDGGEPGLRPEYDANYYGAFVFDPDGNKIEACTFMAK